MNLDEFERERFSASVAASAQARALAIAGAGLVWLFAGDFFLERTKSKPSWWLAVAGALLVVCLLVDVAQLYVRWQLLERSFNEAEKKEGTPEEDTPFVNAGSAVRTWTVLLFHAKFVLLALGYGTLALYFVIKFAR